MATELTSDVRADWEPFGSLLGMVRLVLCVCFDPIGVFGHPSALDEYDGYAIDIVDLLVAGAELDAVEAHLTRLADSLCRPHPPCRLATERIMMAQAHSHPSLYRPVGQAELDLIAASSFTAFPPRLPIQPIFHPILTPGYAAQIARDWNTKDSASGFVGYLMEFQIGQEFIERYEIQKVGNTNHLEYWVPAEELDLFNANLKSQIRVIAKFKGDKSLRSEQN